MNVSTRAFARTLACAAVVCALAARPASAFVPQTITIDGVNDFLNTNLIENDSTDTQHTQLDLRRVYITNDANKLYFGLGHDKTVWTTVQIGIMISTVTKNGATNDMWGHRIAFNGAHKPGYGAYKNYDNNWQEFRQWTGTAWSSALRAGPGANGMSNTTNFQEISFLLCELGLSAGDSLWFEVIVTQDGSTKGPLDLSKNDAVQLSTPGGTVFDPPMAINVPMTWGYRVQSTGDVIKPTVSSARKSAPFNIAVTFSEPVQLATAQNPSNYALTGTGAIVVDAVRRTTECNVVDLALSSNILPQAALYKVTVTNVQDQAGNVILANNTTNVAEFHLKDVYFRGLFGPYLQNNSSPPNSFSVEGDFTPLTFSPLCDTGIMTDTGTNNIWQSKVEFCVEKQTGAMHAERNLEWKFVHNCTTFEPLGSNRNFLLTSAMGAQDTVEVYWNDEDPSLFLSHPVDVIFRADMNGLGLIPADTVSVGGSLTPLTWNTPPLTRLLDNGISPDAVAGDKIFTKRVRFALGTRKNLEYKFLRNSTFECADSIPSQGNRGAFLNDAEFDTTGSVLGPLTLAIDKYGFCTITNKDIKTIWRLKVTPPSWPQQGSPPVAVRGSAAPLSWDGNNVLLRDNGVTPDLTAGDDVYSGEATFPDSTPRNIEWKYVVGSIFEDGFNRGLFLNDALFSVANPIILADTLDVPTDAEPPGAVARKLVLRQNEPNPFNPTTRIHFEVPREGRYRLVVYNALGRRVRTLLDGGLRAGPDSVLWDGLLDNGARAGSGLYLYALEEAATGARESRKMVLLK
jgi:hypothetical protein